MRYINNSPIVLAHALASGFALCFAWLVSQSAYMQTGLQFIGPLVVIMLIHLIWLSFSRGLSSGFAGLVYRRSTQSAVGMATVILFASIVAPERANAAGSEVVEVALMVVFCVAIIAIVASVVALIIYIFYKIVSGISKRANPRDHDGPDTRFFDFASLAVTGFFLCVFCIEGLPQSYAFDAKNRSVASRFIDAPPSKVWQTMDQATSPAFPLPSILSVFPQPVAVVTDEGTNLGATRRVEFQGREGTGYLTLRIIERTNTIAVFEVLSDTSPYANWVAHQKLIYRVQPEGAGTRLTVTLEFDRLLAPAWFFAPMTKGAAYLAMDVLARDVQARAEG